MEFDSANNNNNVSTSSALHNENHRNDDDDNDDDDGIAADNHLPHPFSAAIPSSPSYPVPIIPEPSHHRPEPGHSHSYSSHSQPPQQQIPNYLYNFYSNDPPTPYHHTSSSYMNHPLYAPPPQPPPPPHYYRNYHNYSGRSNNNNEYPPPHPSPLVPAPPPPHQFLETPSHQPPPSRTMVTTTTLAAAAAAGTLLGLTAAATIRWLNGDDDWYFIHRRNSSSSSSTAHLNPTGATRWTDQNVDVPTGDETNEKCHTVTNQAMEYLRQQQEQQQQDDDDDVIDRSKSDWASQLQGIQESLRTIQESLITNTTATTEKEPRHDAPVVVERLPVQTHLSSVLHQLDHLLRSWNISDETQLDHVVVPDKKSQDITEPDPIPTTTDADAWIIDDPDSMAIMDESPVTVVDDGDDGDEDSGAKSMTLTTTPTTTRTALCKALTRLVQSRPERTHDEFRAGVQTLYLFTRNLSSHPLVPRYRRIYCDNDNYQNHVVNLSGASDLLAAVGFVVPSSGEAPHPSKSRTSKYWDWSPMSSSSSQSPDTMSSKEQNEMEEIYLDRLRDAVAALEILKVAPHDTDDGPLLEQALTAAGFRRDPDTGIVTTNGNNGLVA